MADLVHITQINDTIANIAANLDANQIAHATNVNSQGYKPFVWEDDFANQYQAVAIGQDASIDELTLTDDLLVDEYIKLSTAETNSIRLQDGVITIATAGVTAFTFENDKIYSTLNMGLGTTAPSALLDLQQAGTATATTDMLELTNSGNAASMTATGTGILFNQFYYDGTTPAVADAGRIAVITEGNWTSTASTQDSYMSFQTCLNGTVAQKMKIDSAGAITFSVYTAGIVHSSAAGLLTSSAITAAELPAHGVTVGTIPKAASAIGWANSIITETATGIGINQASPGTKLQIGLANNGTAWADMDGVSIYNSSTTDNAGAYFKFIIRSSSTAQAGIAGISPSGDNSDLLFITEASNVIAEKWRIVSTGILQSTGAQTIQTSTGNLTIKTLAGDGNVLVVPHGTGYTQITGKVGIGVSPTYQLDVLNNQDNETRVQVTNTNNNTGASSTISCVSDTNNTINLTAASTSYDTSNPIFANRGILYSANNSGLTAFEVGDYPIDFYTNATNKFRVGVGDTDYPDYDANDIVWFGTPVSFAITGFVYTGTITQLVGASTTSFITLRSGSNIVRVPCYNPT